MSGEAWIVVDLGFGDSGKGTVTDFLVRERQAGLVIRFNGGAQAGHNVVTADGRQHTFSQFGAGSFVPGVGTHLGPAFVLHPGGMLVESQVLARAGVPDALDRTTVDARALLVSPFQQAAGRLRELLRGPACHGTCGIGVGEAVGDAWARTEDTLCAGDLGRPAVLRRALRSQQARKRAELVDGATLDDLHAVREWRFLGDPSAVDRVLAAWMPLARTLRVVDEAQAAERIRRAGTVICEGAQGALLDQTWGFHPHTTWSDCTPGGALALLDGPDWRVVRVGVLRAYATRHGPGPFPTEQHVPEAAWRDPHNRDGGWQGPFRTGVLDAVMLRYGIEVSGGLDGLAVTCLDQLGDPVRLCLQYCVPVPAPDLAAGPHPGEITRVRPGRPDDLPHRERLRTLLESVRPLLTSVEQSAFIPTVERELNVPVCLESHGPTAQDKRWRKPVGNWVVGVKGVRG